MSGGAIRVVGVRKHFGGIVVAEDIHLEIHAGEILGLIGPNGAGKTTLFNLICGIHAPDGGEIWLRGQPLARMPVYKRARLGIARTWQNIRLFPGIGELIMQLSTGDSTGFSIISPTSMVVSVETWKK